MKKQDKTRKIGKKITTHNPSVPAVVTQVVNGPEAGQMEEQTEGLAALYGFNNEVSSEYKVELGEAVGSYLKTLEKLRYQSLGCEASTLFSKSQVDDDFIDWNSVEADWGMKKLLAAVYRRQGLLSKEDFQTLSGNNETQDPLTLSCEEDVIPQELPQPSL